MDAQPRRPVATLTDRSIIVSDPGVYAIDREGESADDGEHEGVLCDREETGSQRNQPPNRRPQVRLPRAQRPRSWRMNRLQAMNLPGNGPSGS